MKTCSLSAPWLLAACVMLSSATGCAHTEAHGNLLKNTQALLASVRTGPTLPGNRAQFCLERAIINYDSANRYSNGDTALIAASAVAGLGGVTTTAMGGAWPAPPAKDASGNPIDPNHGTKKDIEVVGATFVAAAAGLLTARTALGMNDIALAQRTAAAKQVDTALGILAKYALVDDPADAADGFSGCGDADVSVAKSYPGDSAGSGLAKPAATAQTNQEGAQKAKAKANDTASAAQKKAASAKEKANAAAEKVAAIQKNTPIGASPPALVAAAQDQADAQKEAAQAKQEADTAQKESDCKDADADVADKQVAVVKALGALRRAVFFLTDRDVKRADAEERTAEDELKASRAKRDTACK